MSGQSAATPYRPIVNAIAPPAPIGASSMSVFIIPKKMCDAASMNLWTDLARLAEVHHRVAEQQREKQHLQQIAGSREGIDERGRE